MQQSTGLTLPPPTIPSKANSDPEINSLVQPGRQVFDYQLPPELPGTLKIIGNLLAKGRFAVLYKGEWSSAGKETMTVAIKRVKLPITTHLRNQFRTRIKRETVVWTTTDAHPNILPFIGYQIVDNAPILVSPWFENGNLSNYVDRNPNLKRNERIKLLSDAARGLLHLHNLNPQIVHGAIKPENVIVQDDLVAALCDFGISKLLDEPGFPTPPINEPVTCYHAKELLNDDPATPATDVYGFGGLILAVMSGKQPFWNKRPSATIIAIFNDKTPEPGDHPELPASDPLWKLLYACWSGQPDKRPPMSAVLETLESERGIDELPPQTEPPPSHGVSIIEEESLVRPGYFVFNRELPKPISGTLEKTGELARGGFGDVYRGLWIQPNTDSVPVIIKCVRPPDDAEDEKFKVRVKRETLIWSMVKHRNVLPFIGYQIVDEVPMLVSPWCKNGNLDIYTKAHPELMRSDKLELLRGAARGLLHLHSLKPPIFHGDLKPQNIIVQDNLEAVLCDFGISRVILNEEEHSGWTTSVACIGTKGFQSAEIIDEGPPTTAADVYAFAGVILATMSGNPPFWQKGERATVSAIARGLTPDQKDHAKLPETDSLWVLMRECWSSEPDSRPRTSDLLQRLEDEISHR